VNVLHIARPIGLAFLYGAALAVSLFLSYLLRFDFDLEAGNLVRLPAIIAGVVLLKLGLLAAFGQFGSLLSYFGLPDLRRILYALTSAATAMFIVWLWAGVHFAPPRAVILTDFVISFVALSVLRVGFRLLREGYFEKAPRNGARRKRVAIIGAGDVGASLARELTTRRALGMEPIAFFDDDRKKWHTQLHGIPVHGSPESISALHASTPFDEVIIAMPSVTGRRLREIVHLLTHAGVKFETVPSLSQLITGKVRVTQVRPVEIQDLLGRDPVDLQTERIRDLVTGRCVVVTGAGGSIGSELCRQIASYRPARLLMVERSEFLLFQIEQELREAGAGAEIVPLVADILDLDRITRIFSRYSPSVVFHAAAHKHVPMMEQQPAEAVRNNVGGTRLLADLALAAGVTHFVLISTDKAINPTSVMGATKRIAELYLQALQQQHPGRTKFMSVRFGNVLGSSGSVIPTFKRQIAAGGPVTVTHPDVTRYFMTVNEAVGLVLQSATQGSGGEIFVLDMGQPVKIVDLARQLIELSGLEPERDIEIKFTGLRPGEKLFEELNHSTENHHPTSHSKIMRFVGSPPLLPDLKEGLERLASSASGMEGDVVKHAIKQLVPEYQPYLDQC
jgi:FlaA1/EpsC-like NDP-sugar epimerase